MNFKFLHGLIWQRLKSKLRPFKSLLTPRPKQESDPGRSVEPMLHRSYDLLQAEPSWAAGEAIDDIRIIERIIYSYKTSFKEDKIGPSDQWKRIFNNHSKPMHKIFLKGQFDEIATLLRRPGDSYLFYGFDMLYAEPVKSFYASRAVANAYAKLCKDYLIRIAESIGALRMESSIFPKPYPAYESIPVDDLLTRLENTIGCNINFPNPFPDEIGLATRRGIASDRAIHAIYQAWRIRELLKDIPNPKVLEIGAGLGRTAYYASLFGIKNYTIIDLPFTGASQGYFLMHTLGESQVILDGEDDAQHDQKIKILNPSSFLSGSGKFDLIINVDSLTEMDQQTAESYWQKIENIGSMFLSINHERNIFTVKELIDRSERILSRQRHPDWGRHGYVEELVVFRNAK